MTAQRLPACVHQPPCPGPDSVDHDAARIVASHPEQGWSLLCNGIVLFEDTGELLPDGRVIAPHRPTPHLRRAAATATVS
ncbi:MULTISPECIES: DUF5999 family protein [Actinomadura]|uniref:Amidohydrolase 3 domain-containing protein n=1 Tax=Actinomadura miaoliensis TaxID=430685 RepID=A0ABP7V3A8_9ACTN